MSFPLANEEEKKNGWTLSPKYLKEFQQKVEEKQLGEETPSLEQIEDILLVYCECK